MKTKVSKKIIAVFVALISFANIGNSQVLKWAKTVSGTANLDDKGYATCVDASGNSYMTGYVQNTSTGFDIVVKKYNGSGTVLWTGSFGQSTTSMERGNCIAVDANGNVYVAGTAYNNSTYNNDFVLLKWNSSGVINTTDYPKWYTDVSGTVQAPEAKSVVCVGTSAVYVSGSTYSTSTGWKLVVEKANMSGTGWDASWTAYTYQGSVTTTKHEANDLRADGSYVYVTGTVANSGVGTDCFTVKLSSSSGAAQSGWPVTYSGSNDDAGTALNVDAGGNIYVAGYKSASAADKNGLIIKYNGSGTQQWATTYSPTSNDDLWNDITLFTGATGGSAGYIAAVTGYKTISVTASTLDQDYITATYDANGSLWANWSTNPKTYNGSKVVPETAITDEAWGIEFLDDGGNGVLYVSGRSYETPTEMDITTIGYTATNGTQAWITNYSYNSANNQDEMFNKYALAVKWNTCNCTAEIYVVGAADVGNLLYDCVTLKYSCGTCSNCCRMANPNYHEDGFLPNPFSTSATLRINQEFVVNNATLKIFDMNGKLVSEKMGINTNEILVERSYMTVGIYFYELTDEAGILASGKFIIE